MHARFFERENIVEMIALEVEKDFAVKSKTSRRKKKANFYAYDSQTKAMLEKMNKKKQRLV